MRILFVEPLSLPYTFGGCEFHTQKLGEQLVSFGHNITIFCANATRCSELREYNFTTSNLPKYQVYKKILIRRFPVNVIIRKFIFNDLTKNVITWKLRDIIFNDYLHSLYYGPIIPSLLYEVRKQNPDIIISMNLEAGHNLYTYLAKKLFGYPLVIIPMLHTEMPWVKNRVTKKILKSSDLIIVNTSFEKEVVKSYGITDNKVFVGGVGVNYSENMQNNSIKKKYRLFNSIVILYVGRFDPGKGLDTVILAMPNIFMRYPNVKLLIAGAQDKYFDVNSLINKLPKNYQKKIVIINDFRENKKDEIYSTGNIFVSPSNIDSFGITYLEAWKHGLPVIACKTPQAATFIDHWTNGILVEYNNKKMLTNAIVHLINNPSLRKKMGQNGRNKVLKNYLWSKIAAKVNNQIIKL